MHAPRDPTETPKKIYVRCSDECRSVRISILKGKRRRKSQEQHESPNNLSRFRRHHPLPTREEDAALVLLAKSGDPKAQRQLVANYSRLIRGYAGRRRIGHSFRRGNKEFTNEGFDDLIGRGFEALWRAVLTYKSSMGPFSAYARVCISGQMSEESKAFIKRGLTGETRLDRWLFSHPRATPAELVTALRNKGREIELWEAELEIRAFKARHGFRKYRDEYLEPKPKSARRPPAE